MKALDYCRLFERQSLEKASIFKVLVYSSQIKKMDKLPSGGSSSPAATQVPSASSSRNNNNTSSSSTTISSYAAATTNSLNGGATSDHHNQFMDNSIASNSVWKSPPHLNLHFMSNAHHEILSPKQKESIITPKTLSQKNLHSFRVGNASITRSPKKQIVPKKMLVPVISPVEETKLTTDEVRRFV